METYEIYCDPAIPNAYQFRFSKVTDAMHEAEKLCRIHNVSVRVVRVLGSFTPEARWLSNGVPGYK